jgi:hypothetical protein
MVVKLKEKMARDHILAFFSGMKNLGIGKGEAIALLTETAAGSGDVKSDAKQIRAAKSDPAKPYKEVK